jgi:acyl carrier protein
MIDNMSINEFINMISEALEIEDGSITIDDTMDTVKEWDSLGHLSIIAFLDSIGIDTNEEDAQELNSVAKLVDLARNKGVIED